MDQGDTGSEPGVKFTNTDPKTTKISKITEGLHRRFDLDFLLHRRVAARPGRDTGLEPPPARLSLADDRGPGTVAQGGYQSRRLRRA